MSSRVVCSLMLLSASLSAQRPDTTMVPMELARALAGFGDFEMGGSPQILVGRLPEPRLEALVPKGVRVLGSVVYPSQRNPRTTVILAMAEAPDSAFVLVRKAIEGAGYKAAPSMEEMRTEGGGFVMSAVAIGPNMPFLYATYCGESYSIYVTVGEAVRGSTVRVTTSASLRNTMCDRAQRMPMQMNRMERIQLPTLRPPPGATGGSRGASGSSDSRETRAQLRSPLSAAELIDHYAPQLREQGWTIVNRATDGEVSVLTARRTDSDGDLLSLLLSDVRSAPRDHDLSLRVWLPSRDR